MTLAEQIIAFGGTGVGSLVIGWWINKKKDEIEVSLKEQVFYKNIITDMEEQRTKEKKDCTEKISELSIIVETSTKEISALKENIRIFIKEDKIKDKKLEKCFNNYTTLHEALVFEKEKNESLVEIYNSKDKKKKK
jgi:hypothetical protein